MARANPSTTRRAYPEYLDTPFPGNRLSFGSEYLDHEWLAVSKAQFDEIAGALRAFWKGFPERLFLDGDKS